MIRAGARVGAGPRICGGTNVYIGSSSSSAPNSSSRSVDSRLPQEGSRRIGSMDGDVGLIGGEGVIPGIAGPIGVGFGMAGFRAGLAARLTRRAPVVRFVGVRLPFRAVRVARPRPVRLTRRREPDRARLLPPVRLLAIPRPSPFPTHRGFAPADVRGVCSTGRSLFLSPVPFLEEGVCLRAPNKPALLGTGAVSAPRSNTSQHYVEAAVGAVDAEDQPGSFSFPCCRRAPGRRKRAGDRCPSPSQSTTIHPHAPPTEGFPGDLQDRCAVSRNLPRADPGTAQDAAPRPGADPTSGAYCPRPIVLGRGTLPARADAPAPVRRDARGRAACRRPGLRCCAGDHGTFVRSRGCDGGSTAGAL